MDRDFFVKVVDFAREHQLMVVHDFAYADFTYDGYKPPSFLRGAGRQGRGGGDLLAVEVLQHAGLAGGLRVRQPRLIAALARIKSYLDYGAFPPIQIAAIIALEGPQGCVERHPRSCTQPPRLLVDGLERSAGRSPRRGDDVRLGTHPGGLPQHRLARVLQAADRGGKVAVSPGIGFGEYGDGHVRIALVENAQRIRQAARNIKKFLAQAPETMHNVIPIQHKASR